MDKCTNLLISCKSLLTQWERENKKTINDNFLKVVIDGSDIYYFCESKGFETIGNFGLVFLSFSRLTSLKTNA